MRQRTPSRYPGDKNSIHAPNNEASRSLWAESREGCGGPQEPPTASSPRRYSLRTEGTHAPLPPSTPTSSSSSVEQTSRGVRSPVHKPSIQRRGESERGWVWTGTQTTPGGTAGGGDRDHPKEKRSEKSPSKVERAHGTKASGGGAERSGRVGKD